MKVTELTIGKLQFGFDALHKLVLKLAKVRSKFWSYARGTAGLTVHDLPRTFPMFRPFSAGRYTMKAALTAQAINRVFPLLQSLAATFRDSEMRIREIEEFSTEVDAWESGQALKALLDAHGSDKAQVHNFHHLYGFILRDPWKVTHVLEIGLGTNHGDVVSNMGPSGKPGASLRAFRDFCPNALIFGADIDRRILFNEERIRTFFVDQTNPDSFADLIRHNSNLFDLVIDDGLHSPHANIASLEFSLSVLKRGGWVVIEDIAPEAVVIWQVVASILPRESYESLICRASGAFAFAVQRLR